MDIHYHFLRADALHLNNNTTGSDEIIFGVDNSYSEHTENEDNDLRSCLKTLVKVQLLQY